MAGTDLRAVRLGQSHPPSGSRLGEAFPQKIIRGEWRTFSAQLKPPPTGPHGMVAQRENAGKRLR